MTAILAARGFDVYAIDWIGFGMSDIPRSREKISLELQMRVLTRVFDEFQLRDTHILAHDWGGLVNLYCLSYSACC
jgi:pimeloyl-ACP methyl ester carboxylesterase